MEKLLQPIKQEGFSEEIWKSVTNAPDTDKDVLSDGENTASHSAVARGVKRTADGEAKDWNDGHVAFPQTNVQTPPAAMPPEDRADVTDDEGDDDLKPKMYFTLSTGLRLDLYLLSIYRSISPRRTFRTAMYRTLFYTNLRS